MTFYEKVLCILLGAVVALLIIISHCVLSIEDSSEKRTDTLEVFTEWYMSEFEVN